MMSKFFYLKEQCHFVLKIFQFMCFLANLKNPKSVTSSQTLLHIRSYNFDCLESKNCIKTWYQNETWSDTNATYDDYFQLAFSSIVKTRPGPLMILLLWEFDGMYRFFSRWCLLCLLKHYLWLLYLLVRQIS